MDHGENDRHDDDMIKLRWNILQGFKLEGHIGLKSYGILPLAR